MVSFKWNRVHVVSPPREREYIGRYCGTYSKPSLTYPSKFKQKQKEDGQTAEIVCFQKYDMSRSRYAFDIGSDWLTCRPAYSRAARQTLSWRIMETKNVLSRCID